MNKIVWAFTVYVFIMVMGFYLSYKYGTNKIKKTGLLLSQAFLVGTIIAGIDILAVIGWGYFSWSINEFIFVIGIVFGLAVLVISEVVLIAILLFERKKLLLFFNENQ